MVLRYVFLISLTMGAVWSAFNVGASQAQLLLVDAGQSGLDAKTLHLWALGAVAAVIGFSLCRFVIFGLPAMIDSWYQGSKHWIYTIIFGVGILGVFYFMEPPQGPAEGKLPENDPGALMEPAHEQKDPLAAEEDPIAPLIEPENKDPLAAEEDPIAPIIEPENLEVRGSLTAPSASDPRTDGGTRGGEDG